MEQILISRPTASKYFLIFCIIAVANIFLLNFVFLPFAAPFAGDSQTYYESVQFFRGEIDTFEASYRLLKPLVPLLVAGVSYLVGIKAGFLVVNSIFYFLLGVMAYKIIRLLFNDEKQALAGSLLFLFAYPILEYSITYLTETPSWFFLLLSVYLTVLFLKKPSSRLVILNGIVTAVGFLSKEYAVPGGLFFVIALAFLYKGTIFEKVKYFLYYSLFFAAVFGFWQIYVYLGFHYSYFNWAGQNYPGSRFVTDALKLKPWIFLVIIKSLFATFLLGWFLVLAGILKFKKLDSFVKKVLLALILPAFLAVFWPTASSRMYFSDGLLLSALGSWGLFQLSEYWQKKRIYISLIVLFIATNYGWFIIDDRIRPLIHAFFNINY